MNKRQPGELSSLHGLELDSCVVAAHQANEEFLQRRQSGKEHEEQVTYVASDDDLPEVFWSEEHS
jgi:hypothetical protein